jgi:hypothetical protein
MTRFAFGAKCGKPKLPPAPASVIIPLSLDLKKLAPNKVPNAATPTPTLVLDKKARRFIFTDLFSSILLIFFDLR